MYSTENKSLKKYLFIILAFFSLLFIFSRPINISAGAGIPGSAVVPTVVPHPGGSEGGYGRVDTDVRCYRMTAFKVSSPEDANSYKYFTLDGKKVTFKHDGDVVYGKDYYITEKKWFYWAAQWGHTRTITVQNGTSAGTVTCYAKNATELKPLYEPLGLSNLSDVDALDTALQNYKDYGTSDDKLAEAFGFNKGDQYFIVLEEIKLNKCKTEDYFYGFSYGTWMKYNSAIRTHYDPASANTTYFNDTSHWLRQGSIPPFSGTVFGNESKDRTSCYALYGDLDAKELDNAAANIHVQYQGEPNTTDGEFKVASSVIKKGTDDDGAYVGSGESDLYWFNQDDNKWYFSNEWKVLSKVKDKGIVYDASSEYCNIYADYYTVDIINKVKIGSVVNRFSNISPLSIEWGKTLLTNSITGAEVNVGCEILPKKINGRDNTSGILNTALSGATNIGNPNRISDNQESIGLSIIKLIQDTTYKAMEQSSEGLINGYKFVKNKKLGVAIEFTAKSKKVVSHKVTIRMENGVVLSHSETWSDTYPIAQYTNCTLDDNAIAYTVVPNTARNDEGAVSGVTGAKTANQAKNGLLSIGSSCSNGTYCEGLTIGLGATDTNPADGYTIYEVIMTEPEPTPDKGALDLDSYMLNKYFDNVIQTSSTLAGSEVVWRLRRDFTIIKENYNVGTNCPRGCWVYPTGYTGKQRDWNIEWHDASSGTTHVDWDNSMRQSYFPNMETGVWSHSNRIELAGWVSEDTEGWTAVVGDVVDYGFNLVRAASGDKRSISGISYPNYADRDPSNLLKIQDQFGVVPSVVYNGGAQIRKPDKTDGSRLATTTERLFMQSRFTLYHGSGYSLQSNTHHHDAVGHSESRTGGTPPNTYSYSVWVVDKPEVNIIYYTFPSKMPLGYIKNNTWSSNTLDYSWTNSYYKYRSALLSDGTNTVLGSSATAHKAISTAAKTSITSGHVGGTNEYRFANVRYNGVTLSFYPEVQMVYKLGGTTWSQVSAANYKTIYTMGEYLRKSKSSSLYLFKLNGNGDGSITGTTYSDAMQGGSNTLGNTKVMIPAGSDVNVAADMNGINIDLYAYALDIIDKSVDSPSFKNSATTTKSYQSVVKSDESVYQKWMGASNIEILKNHFLDWTNKILDVENFGADFELKVNGSTKSENFGATIGYINRNTTITEDGVYQLVVENGALQTSQGDYSKMITQIAADYECSEAEATQIWNASGIYTAILEAIESSTSDFNKSGLCSYNPSWTSMLGNSSNWYDEKTRTFVVRRFTNLNNKFCDIIASDKIDYNLAPSGVLNDKQNANAGNTSNANWTVTIYFDNAKSSDVNDYLLDSGTYYTPNTGTSTSGSSNFVTANSSHTILINKAPVKNADFLIPASSTSDFGY